MGDYSKGKLKRKRGLKVLLIVLVVILIVSLAFLFFIGLRPQVVNENMNESAKEVSEDVARNAKPIVVNNLLVGALYDKTWVSADQYYLKSQSKNGTEMSLYNQNGRSGTFTIQDVQKAGAGSTIYITTTSSNMADEYFAIPKTDIDVMPKPASKEVNVNEQDIDDVKKALGWRRILSGSVKISSVYNVNLNGEGNGRIICATNESGKGTGAYSAVIYVNPQGKAQCVKYNYVRDLSKASDWPVYSFKFATDINQDGNYELIIQETKEFDVDYDIVEYKDHTFNEVLSGTMKIK